MIQLLIKSGANIKIKNEKNNTALHHAVERGILDAIRVLIAAGADLNVKNSKGETLLVVATHHDRRTAVELLEKVVGQWSLRL